MGCNDHHAFPEPNLGLLHTLFDHAFHGLLLLLHSTIFFCFCCGGGEGGGGGGVMDLFTVVEGFGTSPEKR